LLLKQQGICTAAAHFRRLEILHQGEYLGFNGLRAIKKPVLNALWHDPSVTITEYLDAEHPEVGTPVVESLFNLGMKFLVAAREVAFAAAQDSASLNTNRNWLFMVDNGPGALARSYLYSLNLQVCFTI
jgi:hypothetical protein